jgi:hypothetical protein
VTGTASNAKQDEKVTIRRISGNVVTLSAKLRYSHIAPDPGVSVYVANLTRNVSLESASTGDLSRRGHVMLMHTPDITIENAGFYGLGRTNKKVPLNNVEFDALGNPVAGSGSNVVGRYPLHIHRTGLDGGTAIVSITGSAVVDGPGWGIVNHSSRVDVQGNVVFNVLGASYVAEAGDELGSFRGNIAIRSTGSGQSLRSREKLQDFAHGGDGFWMQGPGVDVQDNVAVGQAHAGFVYFTRGLVADGRTTRFPVRNLKDPSLAPGKEFVDIGDVPISLFQGNRALASARGLEVWFHRQGLGSLNAPHSVLQDFMASETKGSSIFLGYSGELTLRDAVLLGDVAAPAGTGIETNDGVRDLRYENVRVEGFQTGVEVPLAGTIVVQGGFFNNVRSISVPSAAKRGRHLTVHSAVTFGRLSDAALNGRAQFDISLDPHFDVKDQDITKLFNPDVIVSIDATGARHQLYYYEQAAEHVPFAIGTSPAFVPPELLGKTNAQLAQERGLAIGGAIAPIPSTEQPRIHAIIGAEAAYPTRPELLSDRFSKQLIGYQLVYRLPDGTKVYEGQPTDLRPGWNVLTRLIAGRNETFFVFGVSDQSPPPGGGSEPPL